nr:DUF3368 domain-containing protein [Salinibacter ruber]
MTVHGVLWILDRLLEEPIITENRAATALNAMLQQGARLPDEPVENRLDEWRSS